MSQQQRNDLPIGTKVKWLEGAKDFDGRIIRRFEANAASMLPSIKDDGVHYQVHTGKGRRTISAALIVSARLDGEILFNEEVNHLMPTLIGLPANNRNIEPDEYRVLVVDDNAPNLASIVGYLQDFGFQTLAAGDGQAAMTLAMSELPDLILVDAVMPGQDGYDVCRQLNAMRQTKNIPVIIMLLDEEAASLAYAAGAVDYLIKPIRRNDLFARASTHLHMAELSAKVRQADADKDRFYAIIAHDLRGPFQPLLGMAQLLYEAETLSTKDIQLMAGSVYRAAKQLHQLLENLLEWSMLQMGRMEFKPQRLNMWRVAEDVVRLLGGLAEEKGVSLGHQLELVVLAEADYHMMAMVVRNLTANAIKFTPEGGQVTITAQSEGDFVKVGVVDTGVGISPENAEKLFRLDAHHTTPGTNKEKGTGLGLLMCAQMVKKHGGKIWVESQVGVGTKVYFKVKSWRKDNENGTENGNA